MCRMRPVPNDPQKLWRKAACCEKVAPRSYEVVFKGKRYRRNRKHLAVKTDLRRKATNGHNGFSLTGMSFAHSPPARNFRDGFLLPFFVLD